VLSQLTSHNGQLFLSLVSILSFVLVQLTTAYDSETFFFGITAFLYQNKNPGVGDSLKFIGTKNVSVR
jgi:hypothetical protein